MKRLTILTAVAMACVVAQAHAGAQSQPTPQKGPFGLPDIKTLADKLDLSGAQEAAIKRLYSEGRKDEQKIQQAAAQKKAGNNNAASANTPTAAAVKTKLIDDIKSLLTVDQKPKFDALVQPAGKKKKP